MNTIVTHYGMARLTPLHDRILVRRIDEQTTEALIIIPDSAKENTKIAEVIAAGPKAFDIKEGDIVLLPGVASKYPDWEQCDMMMVELADVGGIFEAGNA